jgi:class 3 adenylate cyclase/TolB-like protein
MMESPQKQKRQLSAILFADIEGYTALMQKDETLASAQLKKFQKEVAGIVEDHNGEVINFYGDGALCVFKNPLYAVQCAISLQSKFAEDPKIPVRIGIHMGTVVFEEDKVFGNSVNIASRVESIGVPGSILISKKVRDEIKNHPEIATQSLGKFEFKNVDDGMEVFAVSKEGLIVPNRNDLHGKFKTQNKDRKPALMVGIIAVGLIIAVIVFFKLGLAMESNVILLDEREVLAEDIRDKKVAVMVFKNQTMDASLDAFGMMASDWITQGLIEHTEAKVISGANQTDNVQLATMGPTEFAKSTKAEYVIEGRYYLRESSFLIHANLIDGSTGEVIFALNPPLEGSIDDPMPLLKDLQQGLLSYWILKDEKWVGKDPPKFEAYQEYLKSLDTWQTDQKITEKHLRRAFEMDSTYYSAILKLAVNYFNFGEREKGDSCIQFLKKKKEHLSKFEKMRFDAVSLRVINGRKEKIQQAQIYERMQEEFGMYASNAVQDYSFTNYAQKATEVYEKYYDTNNIGDKANSQRYFGHFLESKLALGLEQEVVEILENMQSPVLFVNVAMCHLIALTRIGDMEKVDYYLTKYEDQNIQNRFGMTMQPGRLLSDVCQELYVSDKLDLLDQYAKRPFVFDENSPGYSQSWGYHLALLFFNKRYDECLAITRSFSDDYAKVMEVLVLSKMGKDIDFEVDITNKYGLAMIEVAKGNKKEAFDLLVQSHEDGMPFVYATFHNDFTLKDLKGYPPFEEFIKPKEID